MSPQSRTLVISFPRSGFNWLRHCTEYFSGMRTPGRKQIVPQGPLLFDRTHDVARPNRSSNFVNLYAGEGDEIYRRVALLLRNPYDCFASHYLSRRDFSFKKGLVPFETFANNVAEFDRLRTARKAVFYFEDYINKEEGTFAFLRFLEVDPTTRRYDFKELVESSRVWYRNEHGLLDKGERPTLTQKERAAIRKTLERKLGAKFQDYLGRYHAVE